VTHPAQVVCAASLAVTIDVDFTDLLIHFNGFLLLRAELRTIDNYST
jgi:hypothetical protein